MKRIFFLIAAILFLTGTIALTGCKKDKTAPVITLTGSSVIICSNLGGTYTEPGYSASDNVDGDITSRVVVTNPVNPIVNGTYYIKYDVTDKAGNAAIEVTRTVIVEPC